jgi:hypothetical protein
MGNPLSPEMGDSAQSIINRTVLQECDLLVGIFWTRIGTPTEEYASGTVEEIERHIDSGKPAMLYFSSAPVMPDSVDPDQYRSLFVELDGALDVVYGDFKVRDRVWHSGWEGGLAGAL